MYMYTLFSVSSDEMEFATYTGIPYEVIMKIRYAIWTAQMSGFPGSHLTLLEESDKVMNFIIVANDMGFFSL